MHTHIQINKKQIKKHYKDKNKNKEINQNNYKMIKK